MKTQILSIGHRASAAGRAVVRELWMCRGARYYRVEPDVQQNEHLLVLPEVANEERVCRVLATLSDEILAPFMDPTEEWPSLASFFGFARDRIGSGDLGDRPEDLA